MEYFKGEELELLIEREGHFNGEYSLVQALDGINKFELESSLKWSYFGYRSYSKLV